MFENKTQKVLESRTLHLDGGSPTKTQKNFIHKIFSSQNLAIKKDSTNSTVFLIIHFSQKITPIFLIAISFIDFSTYVKRRDNLSGFKLIYFDFS